MGVQLESDDDAVPRVAANVQLENLFMSLGEYLVSVKLVGSDEDGDYYDVDMKDLVKQVSSYERYVQLVATPEIDLDSDETGTDDSGSSMLLHSPRIHIDVTPPKFYRDDAAYSLAQSMHDIFFFCEPRAEEEWSWRHIRRRAEI